MSVRMTRSRRPASPYDNVKVDDDNKQQNGVGGGEDDESKDEAKPLPSSQSTNSTSNNGRSQRRRRSLFIGVCKDIDEMLGNPDPLSPNAPHRPGQSELAQVVKKVQGKANADSLQVVDAASVKVHESVAMTPKVEAYTEEIDHSAVRIRENKGQKGQLQEIVREVNQDGVRMVETKGQKGQIIKKSPIKEVRD